MNSEGRAKLPNLPIIVLFDQLFDPYSYIEINKLVLNLLEH